MYRLLKAVSIQDVRGETGSGNIRSRVHPPRNIWLELHNFFVVDSRKDCRRCLILSVPERPIMYMYRVCVLSLPDLMGYPALWPTLINEVGPKRRKCKAKKNCRCKNLESFGKFDCDCFGQEKCGDKCRR